MLETNLLAPLPSGISTTTLESWGRDHRERLAFLQRQITLFERKYNCSLTELEARLARGEGAEHPDWEDSIAWRNALELREQLQLQERLFIWLSRSATPSTSL